MRDELKKLKKAVRDKCLECSGGTPAEVALCELEDCPLFPFRVELWPSLFDAPPSEVQEDDGDGPDKPDEHSELDDKNQLSLF